MNQTKGPKQLHFPCGNAQGSWVQLTGAINGRFYPEKLPDLLKLQINPQYIIPERHEQEKCYWFNVYQFSKCCCPF